MFSTPASPLAIPPLWNHSSVGRPEYRSNHAIASREVAEYEARFDQTSASQARIRVAQWKGELDLLLYKLTLEARKRLDKSPLSKREIIRRLERGDRASDVAGAPRAIIAGCAPLASRALPSTWCIRDSGPLRRSTASPRIRVIRPSQPSPRSRPWP